MIQIRKAQLKAFATILFFTIFAVQILELPFVIAGALSFSLFIALSALTQAASATTLKVAKGFGLFFIVFGLWLFSMSLYADKGNPLGAIPIMVNGALLIFPAIVKKWIIVSDPFPILDGSSSPIPGIMAAYDNSIVSVRWLGCWIDMLFFVACLLISDQVLGNALYQKTIAIWIALGLSNYIVGEWLWGRSLGKLVTGTIVVNAQGGRPSLVQVLTRTLLRVVEVNPVVAGGVPAGIAVITSKHKQRLGDMLADTYVIRKRDLPSA